MEINFKNVPLITITKISGSIIALIFVGLSFGYSESWLLRVLLQATMFLLLLLYGIETIVYQKRRFMGFLLIGVSVLTLFSMIKTIFVAHQLGIW